MQLRGPVTIAAGLVVASGAAAFASGVNGGPAGGLLVTSSILILIVDYFITQLLLWVLGA